MENIIEINNLTFKYDNKNALFEGLNVSIEKGKITKPVKGATLIGSGIDVMQKVSMVADKTDLDLGIGVCGKDGQSVPVGVGQPALKIDEITVGGTN